MFSLTGRIQIQYFDRSVIHTNWNRINRTPLLRAGLLVQKISRNSIRRRKNRNKASPKGLPPFSHAEGRTPPFKMIYTIPQYGQTRVFVGMIGFGGSANPVPGLHEHGGNASRSVFGTVGRRIIKRNFSTPRQGGLVTKRVRKIVHYPERQFMEPAMIRAIPRMPAYWKNSLK